MLTVFPTHHRLTPASLFVVLALTSVAIADEPKTDHAQDTAPKTLEQGLQHVRTVLEPYKRPSQDTH